MSCLQTLVALSSGEAEYYALIRGACTSWGIQSHYQDWMIEIPIQIYSDSSAAKSVARKRGVGGRPKKFADTPLMAAESSSSWSLEFGCRRGRARNHWRQVARFASGQSMLVKDGCSNHNDSSSNSRLEKYRMVKNDEKQVGDAEPQGVEGQTKCQMFKRDRVRRRIRRFV